MASYAAANVPIVDSTASGVTLTKTIIGDPGGDATYQNYAKVAAAWFVVDSQGKGKALIANVQGITILKTYSDAFVSEVKSSARLAVPRSCRCRSLRHWVARSSRSSCRPCGRTRVQVRLLRRRRLRHRHQLGSVGRGLSGIKIGGSDFQPEQGKALAAGTQSVWTGENLLNIGYTAVDVAVRWVEGMSTTEDSNPQPTQLVTKANVGSHNDLRAAG